MSSQSDLDAAIAAVSAEVDAATAAIGRIEAKNSAPEVLDIAAELDVLRGVHDKLVSALAAVPVDPPVDPSTSDQPADQPAAASSEDPSPVGSTGATPSPVDTYSLPAAGDPEGMSHA